jgi:hypothetical protein
LTIGNDGDIVCKARGFGHVMRTQANGHASSTSFIQVFPDQPTTRRIESGRWFVNEKEVW